MSRHLLLFRHAKSDWSDPGLDDHDRPLADRGLNAAPRMGRYMAEAGLVPDLVLCSTARRAQDTWMLAAAAFVRAGHPMPVPETTRALYMAEPVTFRELIGALPKSARTVCVVGHNPGMERFAAELAEQGGADRAALTEMTGKFPTAGLAVFVAKKRPWSEIAAGPFRLERFVTPRGLSDTAPEKGKDKARKATASG